MHPLESPENRLLPSFLLPQARPVVASSAFLCPSAVLVGAVTIGDECSVWYHSVLRADINRVTLGDQSNIQDGCVLHVSDDLACELGQRVTVGHRAVVHACRVEDEVLIGMSATILDGAVIGPRCIIGAGTVVPKGMIVPEGSLVLGTPGRIVRKLSPEEMKANARLALKYVELSRRYLDLGMHQPESTSL
jgi:gamma-carbonic anhydrase